MAAHNSGHFNNRVEKVNTNPITQTYRVRQRRNDDVFTESYFKHLLKTEWARVRSPDTGVRYRSLVERLLVAMVTGLEIGVWLAIHAARYSWNFSLLALELSMRGVKAAGRGLLAFMRGTGRAGIGLARTFGRGALGVGRGASTVGRGVGRGVSGASRGVARGVGTASRGVSRGAGSVARGMGRAGRDVGSGIASTADALGRGVGKAGRGVTDGVSRGVQGVSKGVESAGRGVSAAGRGLSEGVSQGADSVGRSVDSVGRGVGTGARSGFSVIWMGAAAGARRVLELTLSAGRLLVRLSRVLARTVIIAGTATVRMIALTRAGMRRHPWAPVSLVFSVAFLLVGPIAVDWLASLTSVASAKLSSLPQPKVSVPQVSLPKVTVKKPSLPELSAPDLPSLSMPGVSFQLPEFVTAPVRKLDEMLSGALLEPQARLIVADLTVSAPLNGDLDLLLALVLESQLSDARYYSVVPRERALAAVGTSAGDDLSLRFERAAEVAAVVGAAVVVTGDIAPVEEVQGTYALNLVVLDPQGAELHRVTAEAAEDQLLLAAEESGRRIRRRLGEPDAAEATVAGVRPVLSASIPALRSYARSRAHLLRGRYRQATSAAIEATGQDSAFAAAHYIMADAYALRGLRTRARRVLETTWRLQERLPERERLRLAADRHALAGRHSEAIVAYDRLFSMYRDDVRALKSQAILQRMIGARGRGDGNLKVAYTIDPVDWPPLSRIARFLGYRGRIPSVESFTGDD